MMDLRLIREDLQRVKTGVEAKGVTVDWDRIVDLDLRRRDLLGRADGLRARQNTASDEIAALIRDKKDASVLIASMKEIKKEIEALDTPLKEIEQSLHDMLLAIPNLPHESVPIGGEAANRVVRSWGDTPKFDFQPRSHVDLARDLDILDFERAVKLSGAGFVLYKGAGARLERALLNFMLDLHTAEHGFQEVFPPFLVNSATMTGTGQLPKMAEDMYQCVGEDYWLIPTAEVPVTNMFRDEILRDEDLPVYYAAYTACFRREAGSYGKETRGMIRVHQFNKVEMVKFVRPETSYQELESLVANAETVLQRLGLPYRVLELASGDLSFAAAKCYDLEAFASGENRWLEVSSCSNFEDFQARRANIRFKGKNDKRPVLVHTLNGSGLALARTMIAILENYQQADGSVIVPEVLRPYMGGLERITRI